MRLGSVRDESRRRILLDLIRDNPGRPDKWHRYQLGRLTGLAVSIHTIRRARTRGESFGVRGQLPYLDERGRETLATLVAEAGPGGNRSEVARAFEALEGRPVSYQTVARMARRMFGEAPRPVGGNRRPGDGAGLTARERARAERVARLKSAAPGRGGLCSKGHESTHPTRSETP